MAERKGKNRNTRKGKGKGKGKGRSAADFRKAMMEGPTEAQYGAFERSQQAQFRPAIRELERQSRMVPAMDPRVRELERQMAAERPEEAVRQEYATRLANLNQLISGADTTSAARGVSGAIGALGSALGVEAAPEIAAEAGGVSPGDAVTRAMLSGAAAQFASLEQQTLGDRANRLQQMGMSKAEALKAARQERRQTRLQLAELRGQRIAARPNPLERTLAFLQLDQAIKAGSGYGGGGYGGGFAGTVGPDIVEEEGIPEPTGSRDEASARAEFRNRNRNVNYSAVTGPGRAQGYGAPTGAAQPYSPYTGGWTGRKPPKSYGGAVPTYKPKKPVAPRGSSF